MTSEIPLGISKIGDYLTTRDKHTNFGTCRRCSKKVYWSTNKVVSHIRSGHCSGASEKEVDQFKKDYLYSSPKNLVHRSKILDPDGSTPKVKTSAKALAKRKSALKDSPKKAKTISYEIETDEMEEGTFDTEDLTDDDEGRVSSIKIAEVNGHTQYEVQTNDDEKVEFIIVSGQPEQNRRVHEQPATTPELSKEEKFIQAVYPQYQGKTKLELIDEILDAQRRCDLLKDKVKTFEDTINRLLN